MRVLTIGDLAADFTLLRPDGTLVRLSDFPADATVLLFLRHLAWLACHAHLGEVQARYDEFRRLGAEVLAISFSRPEMVQAYLQHRPLPFPMLADPDRTAYRTFGLEHVPWWKLLAPAVVARYLKMIFGGWLPGKPTKGDDVLQLGGDFVLDARHRLVYAYRGSDPTDQPSAKQLLDVVCKIAMPSKRPTAEPPSTRI